MAIPSSGPTGPVGDQDYLFTNGDDQGKKSEKEKKKRADKEVIEGAERARADVINKALDAF